MVFVCDNNKNMADCNVEVTKFLNKNEAKQPFENSFSQNFTHESEISAVLAPNPPSEGGNYP